MIYILVKMYMLVSNKNAKVISSTSIQFHFIDANKFQNQLNNLTKGNKKVASNIRRKVHIPKFMLELYEERKRSDDDYSKPDVVRSVIPKNAGTLPNHNVLKTFEENHVLIFDIPSSSDDETFFDAELRILTLINIDKNIYSGVERFIKVSVYNDSTNTLSLLHERHIYHADNTWITFNLTNLIEQLIKSNYKHNLLKLVVSVQAFLPYLNFKSDHFQLSLMPVIENIEHDYPILLLSYMTQKDVTKDIAVDRKKRNIEEDYEEESNRIWDNEQINKVQSRKLKKIRNTCKRKQLYIDFTEIHYNNWIVQPSGYEAYQCAGKCFYPVADHLSPTKHAIVQALMHSVAPARATRSCCVPSKLDSISLLYVDDRGVPTYRYGYQDMVVAECGCR